MHTHAHIRTCSSEQSREILSWHSDYLVGMLLAFGGGVYVQIGAAECMPKVYESVQNLQERALCLGTFCLGALAIGLVLLDHQHCSAEGAAGHAH
mmetsp:Transcript_63814/g.142352  ORF Transcript_63814/g.142352 Transcript_63814/m.142352 type:complete len:95 (+) Transcript_63814:1346-1630(+)